MKKNSSVKKGRDAILMEDDDYQTDEPPLKRIFLILFWFVLSRGAPGTVIRNWTVIIRKTLLL